MAEWKIKKQLGNSNLDFYNFMEEKFERVSGPDDDDNYEIIADGYVITVKYTMDEEEELLKHKWKLSENIAEPTCTEDGTDIYVCEECEETKEQSIPKLGHSQGNVWQYSASGHYKSCERCGIQATDLEEHTSVNSCTLCGYTGTFLMSYNLFKMTASNTTTSISYGTSYSTTITPVNSLTYKRPDNIIITMGGETLTSGYTYNQVSGEININNINGNVVITASAVNYDENISFTNAEPIVLSAANRVELMQSYQLRIYSFTPTTTGTYKFWSNDSSATSQTTDPYAYLFSSSQGYTEEEMDAFALNYAQTGSTTELGNKCLTYNDDGGNGYNFSFTYSCTAGITYYLAIRTYSPSKIQSFYPVYVQKN